MDQREGSSNASIVEEKKVREEVTVEEYEIDTPDMYVVGLLWKWTILTHGILQLKTLSSRAR